jgi:tetratricopeptide (TPR) repeat protein
MRCRFCDTAIPEDSLVCPKCGKEFLVVPEYNPLEDILTQEMRNQFHEEGHIEEPDIYATKLFMDTTRHLTGEGNKFETKVMKSDTTRLSDVDSDSGKNASKGSSFRSARRHPVKRKKRRWPLVLFIVLVLLVCGGTYAMYSTYDMQLRMGTLALNSGKYEKAMKYYTKAEKIDPDRPETYIGMANVYLGKGQDDEAEALLLEAVESHEDSVELYQALVDYYEKSNNTDGIRALFDSCKNEDVLAAFSDYVVTEPEFSLSAGTYDSVQELELTGTGTIHYTMDGTDVTEDSPVYTEPLELSEGTTLVRAYCVNAKGIASDVITQQYTVQLPVENAPKVTPSTGQYTKSTSITIEVPEGYTAYYTMNGTTPTTSSTKYTGPVRMPEGESEFSAILVSANGKMSDVTKRYYELNIEK